MKKFLNWLKGLTGSSAERAPEERPDVRPIAP